MELADIMPSIKLIWFTSVVGSIGAAAINLFGGWSNDMATLLIFMALDLLTGVLVAAVFKKSSKTKGGALSSSAYVKGFAKKIGTLFLVLIAARLDITLGVSYLRTAVVLALIVGELISLTENFGLMGVAIPQPIAKAIDILKDKESEKHGNDI